MDAILRPIPVVSFVITCGHGRGLEKSLAQIERCGLRTDEIEILIVDQTDPDARPLAGAFPLIHMMAEDGVFRRTIRQAIIEARGRYIVLLQEDSYPRPGALSRMMMQFEQEPNLVAAVFTVTRTDGTRQDPCFPNTIVRCGTGLRRRSIEGLIGNVLDDPGVSFDYDLSMKLVSAGYDIRQFDDLHVTHAALDCDRQPRRQALEEARDSLDVLTRFYPSEWIVPFARDWLRRCRFQASTGGVTEAYYRGLICGLARVIRPRMRLVMDPPTFEATTKVRQIEMRLSEVKRQRDLKTLVLLDFSANTLSYWLAAKKLELGIVAVADNDLGGRGRRYRGAPLICDQVAAAVHADAAIPTSPWPIAAARRVAQWRTISDIPVIDLLQDEGARATFAVPAASALRRTAARSA